ncbi:MAG: hypothetical protein ABJD07_00005 [Gemmatimonadaceae bacterium]
MKRFIGHNLGRDVRFAARGRRAVVAAYMPIRGQMTTALGMQR